MQKVYAVCRDVFSGAATIAFHLSVISHTCIQKCVPKPEDGSVQMNGSRSVFTFDIKKKQNEKNILTELNK